MALPSDDQSQGRRARKRAETRRHIMDAARDLFLAKGYDATTIDDIAARADISKRSFFDYFPTKESVVVSWQDAFGDLLASKVAARPAGETLAETARAAMSAAIAESVSPDAVAMDQMVRATPSLQGHMHLKYLALEKRLAEALAGRAPAAESASPVPQADLIALLAVGALRLGSEAWRPTVAGADLDHYTRVVFDDLWQALTRIED